MIALDEVIATAKRIDLIINSCDSVEERTMATLVKQSLLQTVRALGSIPEEQFKELCKEQEEMEQEKPNDK